MSDRPALSILIPAWNEEGAIGSVVGDALAACAAEDVIAECLVCVDARTDDRTAEEARAAGAEPLLQQGSGLTGAVLQAADAAAGTVCVVLDGDGQHDGGVVVRLAAPIVAGAADLVTGDRETVSLRRGFGTGWQGGVRLVGARVLAATARLALRRRVPDPLTGMFACRRSDLIALRRRVRTAPPGGYKLLLGLLAATPPDRVRHETVPFLPRRGGDSKLGARVVVTTLGQMLGVLLTRRRSRGAPGG